MRNELILYKREALIDQFLNRLPENGYGYSQEDIIRVVEKREPVHKIVVLSSYPPRECGIATYTQDLITALNNSFTDSFTLQVCALENNSEKHSYPPEVKYRLDTSQQKEYSRLARQINSDNSIDMVLIQHEFGLFSNHLYFQEFLSMLEKPVMMVLHTVLPNPNEEFRKKVEDMTSVCSSIVVMTNNAAQILQDVYAVEKEKITVIQHGTHLVPHLNKATLKKKYGLSGRKVLSTFGLLSAGKGIETTLQALPSIVAKNPDVLFLIIGKTHPGVVKHEGEKYRLLLQEKVEELQLQNNVRFINAYLELNELLEYLQLTDIYLFTSKDPHQAVSGTFSYAMSAGCAVISTPIPHALEVLKDNAGTIIDFDNTDQLSAAVNNLLQDDRLRKNIVINSLHRMVSTAWENSAIAHAQIFKNVSHELLPLQYRIPQIVNLDHIKKMTTHFGMLQFSKLNEPDLQSGYTLDDNARALIAMCMHFRQYADQRTIRDIALYFNFIKYCLQPEGHFLNYVNSKKNFTEQNDACNLADANGRAVWALGYLISLQDVLPSALIMEAKKVMREVLPKLHLLYSTRTMAFIIKGLYYYNRSERSEYITAMITMFAERLARMYYHESEKDWEWYESYLTYGNSVLPEAMLCAYCETGELSYRQIAIASFDFLLKNTFTEDMIKLISNRSWFLKGMQKAPFGEQPIDVAYTILALKRFYDVFEFPAYEEKMKIAFNWFLGNNHLHQIIYNPCTGGCYDGLEEHHVNLNQGAESTLSYLMSRLVMESTVQKRRKTKPGRVLKLFN